MVFDRTFEKKKEEKKSLQKSHFISFLRCVRKKMEKRNEIITSLRSEKQKYIYFVYINKINQKQQKHKKTQQQKTTTSNKTTRKRNTQALSRYGKNFGRFHGISYGLLLTG